MVNRRLKDSFAVGRCAEKVRLQLGTPESIAAGLVWRDGDFLGAAFIKTKPPPGGLTSGGFSG
jgi:hypothetical protein